VKRKATNGLRYAIVIGHPSAEAVNIADRSIVRRSATRQILVIFL